jgi:hypothetical protein
MPSKAQPKLAPKTQVLVVPMPPPGQRNWVLSCWSGVIVRFMAKGDHRGKYEVAPLHGGPTRFVPRDEIEPALGEDA